MSEQIVITAQRRVRAITDVPTVSGYSYAFKGWAFDDGGGGGGDTSGWDQQVAQEIQSFSSWELNAGETPCVTRAPLGVPLDTINRHAKAASAALDSFRGTVEHATLIWEHMGGVGKVPLFTSNQRNFVEINLDAVPAGANVIALVHNHVETPGTEQTFPSAADRQAMDRLYARADSGSMENGISVDPRMLLYIYDEASGRTFVYDRDHINFDTASCDL